MQFSTSPINELSLYIHFFIVLINKVFLECNLLDFCILSLCGLPVLHKGILFFHWDPNREEWVPSLIATLPEVLPSSLNILQDLGKVL